MSFIQLLVVTIFVLMPTMAFSADDLIVIKDYGNTRPSGLPSNREVLNFAKKIQKNPKDLPVFTPYVFPFRSDNFELGSLGDPISHDHNNIEPFIIVGADIQSRSWLSRNKQFLMSSRITYGVVVEADSSEDFKKIYIEADEMGIRLKIMPADVLADLFEINVYPVLVTKKEIMQ